jgi:hypothetical protein
VDELVGELTDLKFAALRLETAGHVTHLFAVVRRHRLQRI